jgi:hypothetical protein
MAMKPSNGVLFASGSIAREPAIPAFTFLDPAGMETSFGQINSKSSALSGRNWENWSKNWHNPSAKAGRNFSNLQILA